MDSLVETHYGVKSRTSKQLAEEHNNQTQLVVEQKRLHTSVSVQNPQNEGGDREMDEMETCTEKRVGMQVKPPTTILRL